MKKSLVIFVFSLFVTTSAANAASTGWINAKQASREYRQFKIKKMIPTSINCKAGNKIGQSRQNTMLRMEYEPKSQNMKWALAWGDHVTPYSRKYLKKGFRLVSSGSFTRKSGLRIKCAIWHK